jgi:hypothetical protein
MVEFDPRKFLKATTLLMAAPFVPTLFNMKKTTLFYHFPRLAGRNRAYKELQAFQRNNSNAKFFALL